MVLAKSLVGSSLLSLTSNAAQCLSFSTKVTIKKHPSN